MAYDSLKNIIRQYIKTNGEQEITGQIMQNVLIEMVNNYPSTEGYIRATLSNLANGDILVYDSVGAWYNTPMSSFLAGYATQLWVNQQGYVTSSALAGYIHPTITDLANGDILVYDSGVNWVNAPLDTTISGFGYVKSTGSVAYATSAGSANILGHTVYENPAHALANGDMLVYDSGTGWTNVETSSILSGYATQSWVNTQLANYLPLTGGTLTGSSTFLNFKSTTANCWIQFYSNNVIKAACGYYLGLGCITNEVTGSARIGVYDDGTPQYWPNATGNIKYTLWHEGNLSNVSQLTNDAEYITSSALNGYIHPTLTNLANGDVLIYDSVGSWVNTNLNTTIAGFGYITSSALTGYLPLSGGTMTGTISFTTLPCIRYLNGGTSKMEFGYYPTGRYTYLSNETNHWELRILDDGGFKFAQWTTGTVYNIWHSGNLYNVSQLTNDAGYVTSSGSCAYATSAGSANILGHVVYENTAHSLSNGDTLVYDAGVAWVNVASGLSDIRQKSVISYEAEPMFEAVANAPAIRFTWKDATYSFRRGIHVGSIAQYWQTTLPETVTMDNDGMLSMKYDVIALLSTISVAKKVSEHERRIVILERENEELRKELAALKSA